MPPEPARSVVVAAATWPTRTAVAAVAKHGVAWCSATQNRW
ncbi:hypothetical protein [Amycolatopsis sp.]|nr:hypothetical protein [Amycolatopsis sp.]